MSAAVGVDLRASIYCDGCGHAYTIHAYGINKTRQSAQNRGWNVAGYQGARTDWCPDCEKPAPDLAITSPPALFELEVS